MTQVGRIVFRFSLVVAVVLALTLPVLAQVQYGSITGTVSDPTGAVVPGAEVKLARVGGGTARTVQTNAAGNYRVSELPVGEYDLTVSAEGFKTVTTKINLAVGTVIRVDFPMELGARAEVITVEAGASLIQTETGQLSEQVRGRQIEDLPLNGRNVYDLIQLAPGAANAAGVSFENGEGTVVNGMRPNFNGFLINGVQNRQLSGGSSVLPNPDLVEEFQMLTLNTSAQYGNVAGSINNLVTKSGGNDFHGSVYWFFRNDALDANEFFRNWGGLSEPALVRFNQFGASGTGRIIKDRLFWTGSYEGTRFTTEASAVPIVIESQQWRDAIIAFNPGSVAALLYSDFPPNTPLGTNVETLSDYAFDPTLDRANFSFWLCEDNTRASLASQFQSLLGVTAQDQADMMAAGCSVIPALQAAAISRDIPFRVDSVAAFAQHDQTYGDLAHGDRASVRFDYASTNHHWFGELWYYEARDPEGAANVNSGVRGIGTPSITQAPNMSSSWTWTISPTVINDLRVGFSRNTTNVVAGDPGVPSIGFDDGTTGFGSYNGYPQFFTENVYSYSDMVSVTKGNHNMRMGVDYKDNRENSTFNVGRPSYYFFDHLLFAVDAPYFVAAGVDPGFVGGSNLSRLDENNRAWQNFEVGMYFQDDWKVRPNLTLNLGIRYDYYDRHKERFGRQTTFFLPPGTSLANQMLNANIPAGNPGCDTPDQIARVVLVGVCGPGGFGVTDSLGRADRDNWGPRFGFAWAPWGGDKTVIRGGFAISYEGTLYNPLSNSRWNPPFFSFNLNFNDLGGGSDFIVYGPTTCTDPTDGSTCGPSGDAPDWTSGATTNGVVGNIGSGPGVLSAGNIQGYFPGSQNLAFLTGIVLKDRPLQDPWITSYHLGFQHELLTDFVLEVNYVGTRGRNLFRAQQINRQRGNALPVDECGVAGTPCVVQGETLVPRGRRRLNPNYGTMRAWFNTTDSWYNSLQAAVRKRMSHGVMFDANYTWSHSIDTGSGWHSGTTTANGAAAGDAYSLDIAHPELDKGNSTFDIRHRFVGNWLWDMPFGSGATGAARKVFHGWQFNGSISAQSGAHWSPYCSTSACDFNFDGERNDRPDVGSVGDSVNYNTDIWANGWLGTGGIVSCAGSALSCLVGPGLSFETPCRGCNGGIGRNTFTGPSQFNVDLSLFKNTPITERVNLQFRFEVFNVFNHANFLLPSSATGSNSGNQLTSRNFGQSAGTLNARNIQFGLKVLW